jgi:outer membrane protein OmpA-like peptidoglycan-associated protein
MKIIYQMSTALCATLALAACSTTPERIDELEQARAAVNQLQNDPMAEAAAARELDKARSALKNADSMKINSRNLENIRHEAFIAQGYADIGMARVAELRAREGIEKAELKRSEVLREAREAETERAQALAETRGAEATIAKEQAQLARQQAAAATSEARRLQDELKDLQTEQTERGLILTLGDVLFDTDKAELKPGAQSSIEQIAEFLSTNPDRRLLIEGHTDSRGTDEYNDSLSQRRADAVKNALLAEGIAADRIRAAGLGEAHPVATNDTVAGRQQNRRVDVVIASAGERGFPESIDASNR